MIPGCGNSILVSAQTPTLSSLSYLVWEKCEEGDCEDDARDRDVEERDVADEAATVARGETGEEEFETIGIAHLL